ncbi:hypothetical protein V6N13_032361 [Hibiscus sabdariffa]
MCFRRRLALCAIVKSSLMALRSGFTAISSLLFLSQEKIQMLVSGRQGDEVLFKTKGGCERANVEVRAVTAASIKPTVVFVNAEGRIHAIDVSGIGYKMRLTSLTLGHENPYPGMDFCLSLLSPNASRIWPTIPTIKHSLAWISSHAKPCRKVPVSLYKWSHENSLNLHYVELSINICKLLSTIFKGPGRMDTISTLTVFEDEQHVHEAFLDTSAISQITFEHVTTMKWYSASHHQGKG